MGKIRTILIGTSEFAVRIYERIYDRIYEKLDIVAVITAPDKPAGRRQKLTPSPVKKWALENDLKILQPEKVTDPSWIKKIQELTPELIIVAAYGQIIPKEILDIPKFGALNVHPSLLPKYRGPSPIQTTILNGDKETGVTIIKMDEKIDHGPILRNSKFEIRNSKPTHEELSNQLAELGARLLIETLPDWIKGKIKVKPQNHSNASFTKIIKKEDGKINWNKSAEEIERQIRALNPWPGTWTEMQNAKGKRQNDNLKLKILEADILNKNESKQIGKVFLIDKNLAVQTGNGILVLKKVQLEGRKPMLARDFLNGHREIVGTLLK